MTDSGAGVFDAVGVAPGRYRAVGVPRPRYRATLGLLAAGLATAMIALSVWDRHTADTSGFRCPPDCGGPPNAVAVANLPRFTAASGAFSVAYPPEGTAYRVSTGDAGVTARYTGGDGGILRLFGEPARGRSAHTVVDEVIARDFPNAVTAYTLPNATVGYQLGYGVVANFQRPAVTGRIDLRLVVIAAVRDDLALVATAEGPFRRFTPQFGPGPPSGANLELALDMGKYVDSFTWRGDAPR